MTGGWLTFHLVIWGTIAVGFFVLLYFFMSRGDRIKELEEENRELKLEDEKERIRIATRTHID